jgi:hypothetical protein
MQTTAKKDNKGGFIRNVGKHKKSKLSTPRYAYEQDCLLRVY